MQEMCCWLNARLFFQSSCQRKSIVSAHSLNKNEKEKRDAQKSSARTHFQLATCAGLLRVSLTAHDGPRGSKLFRRIKASGRRKRLDTRATA